MNKTTPNRSQTYDASDRKTFHSALCHLLQTEFTGTFGPAVTKLFADRVEEVYERFHVRVWQQFLANSKSCLSRTGCRSENAFLKRRGRRGNTRRDRRELFANSAITSANSAFQKKHLKAVRLCQEDLAHPHVPRERLKVGQVLWAAVAVDDPPARDKRIEHTRLVPIVLDLVTPRDIDDAIATGVRTQTRDRKVLRLFQQAYAQGAVLSDPDVSLLLHVQTSTISRTVLAHERETKQTVPRRGTIHDMGRSVTHKAIICYKRLVEFKPTSQVASETYHSPEEVEYYVQCLRRVKLCRDSGMSPNETAQATGHSLSLVNEYLTLITQFGLPATAPGPLAEATAAAPETTTEQPLDPNVPNDPY